MKREAEAVPITPFHVNKQVDTVLWWRRWWWWWCFLSSITPVGGYRVRRMGMGFGVSWKATVIHRSNSVEAIPFPQTGTNRLEQTLAASFLPGNFYKWGDTHSKRGQKGEGVCECVCVCACACICMHINLQARGLTTYQPYSLYPGHLLENPFLKKKRVKLAFSTLISLVLNFCPGQDPSLSTHTDTHTPLSVRWKVPDLIISHETQTEMFT